MILFIGLIIGLILGLTGAGGSIFAVPLLLFFLKLPLTDAVGIALGAIAITASYGTLNNLRSRSILWPQGLLLAGTGALVAPLGKWLGGLLPPLLLLSLFTALATLIAIRMWHQSTANPEQTTLVRAKSTESSNFQQPACRMSITGQFQWRPRCIGSLALGGLLVGLTSGLLGVGSGFLIVPLLLFLNQVSLSQAISTSLLIIALVSGSGFASYLVTDPDIQWSLLWLITAGGIAGMMTGQLLSEKIAGPTLQKTFSSCLIIIVFLTLAHQISLSIPGVFS